MSRLLKSSVSNYCCLHLKADTTMLFLYSRIKGYYQTTPVLIDLEKDTDAVVITAHAASIFNGELAIWRKLQCEEPLFKIMSKTTALLNVTTCQLSHDNLKKFVIKHI